MYAAARIDWNKLGEQPAYGWQQEQRRDHSGRPQANAESLQAVQQDERAIGRRESPVLQRV